MKLEPLDLKELPPALPLKKLVGPSFVILALGLGSGEVILWPYLSAKYGLGIIWGAIIGITFQFFMNMEIERYALARGESVFVGLARKIRALSFWFLLSTFIPWMWPGIIAASAKFLGTVIGVYDSHYLAIGMLALIGIILSFGPVLYKTVERFQRTIITLGVPSILVISALLAKSDGWAALGAGLLGQGDGFLFLPEGLVIASFLGALAYAGAGGNLNLAQSFYIKEKGYGMGKYAAPITSLLTGKKENISLTGSRFEITKENLGRFQTWWKNINIEHFLVFWLTGSVTILLLSLLAYSAVYGLSGGAEGVDFVLQEARFIGERLLPWVGTFFLLVISLTLFGTQLGVFDATSRILSENLILGANGKLQEKSLRPLYYLVLWLQILAGVGILLLGFTEPLELVTIAAVLNAVSMFVHTGLMLWLNLTSLEKPLRPSPLRIAMMSLAFIFYGGFSVYVIVYRLFLSVL